MQVVGVKSIDGAIELADQTIRLQQHAAVIIRMLVGGNHQLCLRFKHQSLVSVGSNPRRLVCLADLKSAPLDHSGKIPRQTDTHAPARKNAFTSSTMTSTIDPTRLHTSSTLIFIVSLPDSRQTIIYSTNETSDHFYHILLDLA